MIEDDFLDPNKPLFFLSQESVPYIGLCSCKISDHLNNSLRIQFEYLCQKTVILRRFGLYIANQTWNFTQDRCQIEGLDDTVAPYITLLYLFKKKSGTSVDVKVDVKNVTEGRREEGEGTRLGFLLG